jgi:hypothetical protein
MKSLRTVWLDWFGSGKHINGNRGKMRDIPAIAPNMINAVLNYLEQQPVMQLANCEFFSTLSWKLMTEAAARDTGLSRK